MRSELVYRANDKVPNRFQLCSLASLSVRSMLQVSVELHTTINKALEVIGRHSAPIGAGPTHVETMKAANEGISPAVILHSAV